MFYKLSLDLHILHRHFRPCYSRYAILALLVLLLIGCENSIFGFRGGSGNGGGPAATVNLFSHNSYTFAPYNIRSVTSAPADARWVGTIVPHKYNIRQLVASRLGITNNNQEILALRSPSNFTISYRLADDNLASDINTFLEIESDSQNSRSNPNYTNYTNNYERAIIRVKDPVGADLSVNDIIELVPIFQVEMLIKIPLPPDTSSSAGVGTVTGAPSIAEITRLVTVNLLKREPEFNLSTYLVYNHAEITEKVTADQGIINQLLLRRSSKIAENNALAAVIGLSKRGNLMSEYAISRHLASDLTLFWRLANPNNMSQECADGNLYVDNNDLMVRANNIFDYETDLSSYSCRLAISENDDVYTPLAFAVTNNAELVVEGKGVNGASVNSIVQVAASRTATKSCLSNSNNSCYYADLQVELVGVDEEPIIGTGNAVLHLDIAEGVGPITPYDAPGLTRVVSGKPLSAGLQRHAIDIYDEDKDANLSHFPVSSVRIVDITPNHNVDIFSIIQESLHVYQLQVNSSILDYERFTTAELTNGKAIYLLTLEAVDGIADGGGPKRKLSKFSIEVEDVIYRPLFVAPTALSSPSEVVDEAVAFIKDPDASGGTGARGSPIYLLPSVYPFTTGRHRLGTFAALDPERGDDRDLLYSFIPVDLDTSTIRRIASPMEALRQARTYRSFAENFALIDNLDITNARGKRLIIANTALTEENDNIGITLQIVHKNTITPTPASSDVASTNAVLDAGYVLLEQSTNLVSLENAADPRLTRFIDLEVIDSTTARGIPGLPNADTLRFNHEFPLVGEMREVTAGASVAYPGFRDIQRVRNVSIEDLSAPIIIPAEAQSQGAGADIPHYGFFPLSELAGSQKVATDLANLRLLYIENPTDLFQINSETGRISATGNSVLFPGPYILLVYITSQANFAAAGSEVALFRQSESFDVAALSILMLDVNTPPTLFANSVTTDNIIRVRIRENLATSGTELARFTIRDDNDKLPSGFTANLSAFIVADDPSIGKVEDLLEIDFVSVPGAIDGAVTGIITLKSKLDYETQNELLGNLRLNISDSGVYDFSRNNYRSVVFDPPQDIKSSDIYLSIDLQDVDEPPRVSRAGNINLASISESAGSSPAMNTFVTTYNSGLVSNSTDLFVIENLEDFVLNSNGDRQVDYAVLGDYADILKVVEGVVLRDTDKSAALLTLRLEVADPVKLENLGDGRVFVATVRVKDLVSGLSGTASLPVLVSNDPANSKLVNINNLLASLSLSIQEQEIVGARPFVSGFDLHETDLIADADEFLSIASSLERFNLQFEVIAQLSNNHDLLTDSQLKPLLSNINALEVIPEEETFRLRIVDTDFVEKALFGNLEFVLNVTDTLTGSSDSGFAEIAVIPEEPKAVTYADSSGQAANIPVYALNYVQSNYADPLKDIAGRRAIKTSSIISAIGFPRGVPAQSAINLTIGSEEEYYSTVELQGIEIASEAHFIQRSLNLPRSMLKPANNNVVVEGNNANSQRIILNFAESVRLSEEVDILVEDARGNLVDGSRQFNTYFTLEVVSDAGQEPYLSIAQKSFDYTAFTDGGGSIQGKYNALDTIALFENAQQFAVLSYFIRAKADIPANFNDASRYALAQFSVTLQAFGINDPTQITKIALVPTGADFNHQDALAFNIFTGVLPRDIKENEFSINGFKSTGSYDLLVEFHNPDAAKRKEIESLVNVSIEAGYAPNDNDASASDGNLISLRLNSTITSSAMPQASAVHLISSPQVSGGGVDRPFFTDADAIYLMRYDFALARNFYGEATINIKVTDREPGVVLSEVYNRFNIKVAPRPADEDILLNVTFNNRRNSENVSLSDLFEDSGPLAGDASTRQVYLDYKFTDASGTPLDPRDDAIAVLTSVHNYKKESMPEHNGLSKAFIEKFDNESITYTGHGWGVQGLNFIVSFMEQRGFSNDRTVRQFNITQDLRVAAVADPTILARAFFPPFRSREFSNATGQLENRQVLRNADGVVSITDADLLFDSLANTLGGRIILNSQRSIGDTEIYFNTFGYPLIQPQPGVAMLTASGFDYSLNLTSRQLDILRNGDGTQFNLSINFPDRVLSPLIENTMVQMLLPPRIEFIADAVNPRLLASDVFTSEDVGYIAVAEGRATSQLSQLSFTDGDIIRISSKGLSSEPLSSGLFVFDPIQVRPSNTQSLGLLRWEYPIPQTTLVSPLATNNLLLARQTDDADVGEYQVDWRFTDTLGYGGTTAIGGTFTLNVTRVEDAPVIQNISFTNPGDFLVSPPDTMRSGNFFPFSLSFTDDDFLEPAQPLLVNASYKYLDFTLDASASGRNNYNCRVGAIMGNALNVPSPLFSGLDTTSASIVYGRPADASVKLSGNLQILTIKDGVDILRPLTFKDITDSYWPADSDPRCADPLIGTKINGASIHGLTLASPKEYTLSSLAFTEVDYTIRGYRTRAHRAELAMEQVAVERSGRLSTTITIFDGDSDDGVPASPNAANTVRGQDNRSKQWDSRPNMFFNATGCTGEVGVVVGPYKESIIANQSFATITVTAVNASGACSVSFYDNEDGQAFNSTLIIRFEERPLVSIITRSVPTGFLYGDFLVEILVEDGDIDDTSYPMGGGLSTLSPDKCLVESTGNSSIRDYFAMVRPIKPGICSLTFVSMENGAVGEDRVDIALPQLSPELRVVSIRNADAIPKEFAPDVARAYASNGTYFILELEAMNRDPNDDVDRDVDVGFKSDFVAGRCVVELMQADANYTAVSNGIAATALYRIGINTAVSKFTPVGTCGSGNIVFTASEDNDAAITSIAASVFEFEGVPHIGDFVARRGFFNYTDNIEYQFTVTDNDNMIIDNDVSPDLTVASVNASICSVVSHTKVMQTVAEHITKDVYDLIITPLHPGNCRIELTAVDGEYSFTTVLPLVLSEAVPRVVIAPVTLPSDFNYAPILIMARIFDSDVADNKFPSAKDFISLTEEVCAVGVTTNSDASSHSASVKPLKPGECIVSFSAVEDDVVGTDDVSFVLPELPPNLRVITIRNGDKIPVEFAADVPRAYTANGTSFVVELEVMTGDPGDDAGRDRDLTFKDSFDFENCRVELLRNASLDSYANYDSNNLTRVSYRVFRSDRMSGTCNVGSAGISDRIVFTASEDNLGSNTSIAASVFEFEGVPLLGNHSEVTPFSTYSVNLIYNIGLTDTDKSDSVKAVINSVTTADAGVCLASGSGISNIIGTGIDLDEFSILYTSRLLITPLQPGPCLVLVTAVDEEYSVSYNFTVELPQLPPSVRVAVTGPNFSPQGAGLMLQVIATKTDPGIGGQVVFPNEITDGASCTAVRGTLSTAAYTAVGDSINATYTVRSSSPVGDVCGEFEFRVADDGAIGSGRLAANVLQFNGAAFGGYQMVGGRGTSLQAAGEIIAISTGEVWFDVVDGLEGCDIYPQGAFAANSTSEGSITILTLRQNNRSVGNPTNDCTTADAANRTEGSILLTAYSGVLGDTSNPISKREFGFAAVKFNPPAVVLRLHNESPYYLMNDRIRPFISGERLATYLEDPDNVHIYKHLEPRGWSFGNGNETIAVASTPGNGLVARALERHVPVSSWLLEYHSLTSASYSSDNLYINLSGVVAAPSILTTLIPYDNRFDGSSIGRYSLADRGYTFNFFESLSRTFEVDGYLRFISRPYILYAGAAKVIPTFATKDSLVGIVTDGVASLPSAAASATKVKLQARVCHLADIPIPEGVDIVNRIPLDTIFSHSAALSGVSISCYGKDALLFDDAASRKISTLGGIWQQGEDTPLCDSIQGYDPGRASNINSNNESCTSFATLNSVDYGRVTYDLTADASASNPVPWNFQQYIRYRGFTNPDRTSMNYPAIYLVEVYPLAGADTRQVLGRPLKMIFQVVPR